MTAGVTLRSTTGPSFRVVLNTREATDAETEYRRGRVQSRHARFADFESLGDFPRPSGCYSSQFCARLPTSRQPIDSGRTACSTMSTPTNSLHAASNLWVTGPTAASPISTPLNLVAGMMQYGVLVKNISSAV